MDVLSILLYLKVYPNHGQVTEIEKPDSKLPSFPSYGSSVLHSLVVEGHRLECVCEAPFFTFAPGRHEPLLRRC